MFVFQMGKVASSSVFDSLTRQYPGPVGHAHRIEEDNWMSMLLYDWAKAGNTLKIISPVREPIGRNISGFFQQFEDHTGVSVRDSRFSQAELDLLFLNKLDHDEPLTWFDTVMKPNFGIDVYATPFPKDGCQTYVNGNVSLLVFRIDIPDASKEDSIRTFLNFPSFHLEKSNASADKEYNTLYNAFKKNTTLPTEYLDRVCNSRYFRHFFSEDEISSIRDKWENN